MKEKIFYPVIFVLILASNASLSESGGWNPCSMPTIITTGDLDGDEKNDLVGRWSDGVWVKYSSTKSWSRIASPAITIAVGDMNADGREDLVGVWTGQGTYYRNSVTGSWVKLGSPASLIDVGDADGDGKDDLIGQWSDGLWIRYQSTGRWFKVTSTATASKLIATRYLDDERDQILVTWPDGSWYFDTATKTWHRISDVSDVVEAGDIDGDGISDLLGVWSDGVWAKYMDGAWTKISSSIPIEIAAGYVR